MAREQTIDWKDLKLKDGSSITVSNPNFALPEGLTVMDNFISESECGELLNDVNLLTDFSWEGFEQRRKVRRFKINEESSSPIPNVIQTVLKRFIETTGYQNVKEIALEEFPESQLQKHFTAAQTAVTTFESTENCKCQGRDGKCSCCFVGIIPILKSVIASTNRPKVRETDCWNLCSKNHRTGLLLKRRSLILKTDDFLWNWRSRISSAEQGLEKHKNVLLLKFFSLPQANVQSPSLPPSSKATTDSENEGPIHHDESFLEEVPLLEDLLTIIVTTSPIKSNPSTELLERVFETFIQGGKDFAYKCRKVIVCDGCRKRGDAVSRKHNNIKQAMRNGIVDESQLRNYKEFKENLKSLCTSAREDSPFFNTHVEELESRNGYGFALKHVLHECVATPYVIVIQHDRTFMRKAPIRETLTAMFNNPKIKYVGMNMRSNLMYCDQFVSKYGKAYKDEFKKCVLRPRELILDNEFYGPKSTNIFKKHEGSDKMRKNLETLKQTYRLSLQNSSYLEFLKSKEAQAVPFGKTQLSLIPTFFWYDNIHICSLTHYRDFIFDPDYKMVARGGFVEDKVSPVMKRSVERFGLTEGHSRFGSYLLDDHSGCFFTGHLDGGNYLTKEEKSKLESRTE